MTVEGSRVKNYRYQFETDPVPEEGAGCVAEVKTITTSTTSGGGRPGGVVFVTGTVFAQQVLDHVERRNTIKDDYCLVNDKRCCSSELTSPFHPNGVFSSADHHRQHGPVSTGSHGHTVWASEHPVHFFWDVPS